MYAVTRCFYTFAVPKELYIFLKEKDDHSFLSYQALFIYKKLATADDGYLGWGSPKFWLFIQKS